MTKDNMDVDDSTGPRIIKLKRPQIPDEAVQMPWVEKYRPATLEDLVAHEDIISILTRLIDNDNLPHLLLYGPPGTGKVRMNGNDAILIRAAFIDGLRNSLYAHHAFISYTSYVIDIHHSRRSQTNVRLHGRIQNHGPRTKCVRFPRNRRRT